ncbi:MAG: response regulator transcription factor [Egibacteraceae bacterium]
MPATDRLQMLSDRELQVAELVSTGHTNRQIARSLSLSEKTVETYLRRIFAKLGVSSRAAVASAVAWTEAQLTA